MKSVLFVSRTCSDAPGGMQTHVRTLLSGLYALPDLRLETCCYGGPRIFLPFFLCRALAAVLLTRATTVVLGDAVLSPVFIVLACFRPAIRRALIVHGLDLTWNFPGYRALVRHGLRRADRIVPVSRYTAGLLSGFGIAPEKIVVIPCPVPPSDGAPRVRLANQILLLGRLVERKGTRWFLDAVLPLLHAEFPDLHVVIAGDGPLLGELQKRLASSSFAEQVWIIGGVSGEEKETLLRESALLLVPNLHRDGDPEGFGIVCLEAAVRGLPVVAARTDGLTDAVADGVSGMFFESGSPADCVRVIREALRFPWDADLMKAAIQERFSLPSVALRFFHDVF